MNQLYPPSIAGTLPSFYKSKIKGTAIIVVPFTMNKTTRLSDVSGFSLRIKTTNTDILYGILESNTWSQDIASPSVSFVIPEKVLNRLTIGSFYKVQLAYIDRYGVTGYYSSVGIMKCTAEPTVEISDFLLDTTNVNQSQYIGVYKNPEDPTEKVYQYRFNLYSRDNQLIETSGWLSHNSYEDTSLTKSIDKYMIRTALVENVIYKINYQVITNNGLEISSPKYLLMEAESIDPELKTELVASLDYENACINLALRGEIMGDGSEHVITGAFILSRASSLDNYSTWLPISTFRMTGQKPSSFLLKDYTIMQGVTYVYSLQQFNDYDIYSNRTLSKHIEAQFEDAYLFDGERQLRIRYNPKISSFKTVVQESKKNTLGSKYPYIFRSGATAYKEFPINGLVTYFMDDNEAFVSKEKDLYISNWKKTTDITDENVLLERLFKLEVLNWLNNGKPKLFKSPQEGNYIVRIMNVSFSPIDTVSRMLHNFSCQATEVAEYTPDNLITYGLLNSQSVAEYQMRWETIVLADRVLERKRLLQEAANKYAHGEYTDKEYVKKVNKINSTYEIYNTDLFRGQKVYHLKIEDMIMGTTFSFWNEDGSEMQQIMIGATGSYEVMVDNPITNLRMLNQNNTANNNSMALPRGSITFGIKTASQNRFDIITKVYNQNIPVYQINGPHENVLADYQNLKRQTTRLNYARFTKLPVQEVYSSLFAMNLNGNLMTGKVVEISNENVVDIPKILPGGQIMHTYYRYYEGRLYVEPHFDTELITPTVIDSYTFYRDSATKLLYYLNDNQFLNVAQTDAASYTMKDSDLNTYTVYLKRFYKKNPDGVNELVEEYYRYNGVVLEKLDGYSTLVYLDDVSFDVGQILVKEIVDVKDVPNVIKVGSGVQAEIGIQVKIIEYSVENSSECEDEKAAYERYLEEFHATALGLELVNHEDMVIDGVYKLWNVYNFQTLVLDDETLYHYHDNKYMEVNVYQQILDVERLPSQADINAAYDRLQAAQKKYFAILEELLREQEEENTYE